MTNIKQNIKACSTYLETTCWDSVKKIVLILVILLVYQLMYGWMFTFKEFEYPYNSIYYIPVLMAFIIINIIHAKRVKAMVKDGAFHRIRLLPNGRYAFLASEILCTAISYVAIVLVEQIEIALLYFKSLGVFEIYQDSFWYYCMNHEAACYFTPFNIKQLLIMISIILSLSFVFTFLNVSLYQDHRLAGAALICMIAEVFILFYYLYDTSAYLLLLIILMIGIGTLYGLVKTLKAGDHI